MSVRVPICYSCVHYQESDDIDASMVCTAYPNGIPEPIIESDVDHRLPYSGDRGIRFEQNPERPQPPPLSGGLAAIGAAASLDTLVAAPKSFSPDLHPRGRDGQFIEKFGLVKLLSGIVKTPEGKKIDVTGRTGQVDAIIPDPKAKGRPTIRVGLKNPNGTQGPSIDVKPEQIVQSKQKGHLAGKPSMSSQLDLLERPRPGQAKPPSAMSPQLAKRMEAGPKGQQARLRAEQGKAAREATRLTDTELAERANTGNVVWKQAIKVEQINRRKQAIRDQVKRQQQIDWINSEAAKLSTDDPEARWQGLEKLMGNLRFSPVSTDNIYDNKYPPGGTGERWTPERHAQHEEMWAELQANLAQMDIPQDRDAFVLGGLPASGKTYALRPGQKAEQFGVVSWEPNKPPFQEATHISINPDTLKEMMAARGMLTPGISPDLKPLEQATLLHSESAYLAKLFQDRLTDQGYNVVIDRTFESTGAMDKVMPPLAREGYRFRGLFIDIPVEESRQGIKDRYLKEALTPEGGRFVPSSVVGNRKSMKGNLSKNRDSFDTFVKEGWFDDFMIIDNTGLVDGHPKGEIVVDGPGGGTAADTYLQENDPESLWGGAPAFPAAPSAAPAPV